MHSHNTNIERTSQKNGSAHTVARHVQIRAHSHTPRARLTKTSALFEQNPNVISRTNSNIHVCAAVAHLHTEYTQCQYWSNWQSCDLAVSRYRTQCTLTLGDKKKEGVCRFVFTQCTHLHKKPSTHTQMYSKNHTDAVELNYKNGFLSFNLFCCLAQSQSNNVTIYHQ